MTKNHKDSEQNQDDQPSSSPVDEQAVRDAHYAEDGVDPEGNAPEESSKE